MCLFSILISRWGTNKLLCDTVGRREQKQIHYDCASRRWSERFPHASEMLHQQNIKTYLSCHYSSKRLCHSATRHRGPSLWCVMSRCDENPRNEHKLQRGQQQHTNILTLCTLLFFTDWAFFQHCCVISLERKNESSCDFFISSWFNVKFCLVFSKTKHLILQLVGEPLLRHSLPTINHTFLSKVIHLQVCLCSFFPLMREHNILIYKRKQMHINKTCLDVISNLQSRRGHFTSVATSPETLAK